MATGLNLKPEPDGMGYIYGIYTASDGTTSRVDILPPASEPKPCFVIGDERRHATDWIVFVDGEEIARVATRTDIAAAVTKHLS